MVCFFGVQDSGITFNNPRGTDLAKQKLYVFLSLYGDYLGANHTGN